MTDEKPAPTYRQRFTATGAAGAVITLAAPLVYAMIWSSWTASNLWTILPAFMLILGPIMIFIGREHYDAAEDENLRVIAAERIRQQKLKR